MESLRFINLTNLWADYYQFGAYALIWDYGFWLITQPFLVQSANLDEI